MGCCCSCASRDDDSTNHETAAEMEMMKKKNNETFSVSSKMSSPTIQIVSPDNATSIRGHGLALSGVELEQDAAYWEVHIRIEGSSTDANLLMPYIGVATRKNPEFYADDDDTGGADGANEDLFAALDDAEKRGIDLMRAIRIDASSSVVAVVGVLVQQSDYPMVQFMMNDEICHEYSVNRFRGTVYPAIYLPQQSSSTKGSSISTMEFVFHESEFQQKPTSLSKFPPVMVARGLV